jgi:hypothetical protein
VEADWFEAAPARPRLRPAAPAEPERPAPPRKKPNELSLDDLFGGAQADEDEELPEVFASTRAPSARGRQEGASFFAEAEPPARAPRSAAGPVAAPPAPTPAPALEAAPAADAGRWRPERPLPRPTAPPATLRESLALLGAIAPADRPALIAQIDPAAAADALRAWRSGEPADYTRGLCLWVAANGRPEHANALRSLTNEPDPSVRATAAEALGATASGGLLAQLSRLLGDDEPMVRAAAARALADAARRTDQVSLGRSWLARLQTDPDPTVRDAWRLATEALA